MPRRITFEQADALLRSRDDIVATGITDRQLRSLVATGTFVRVHRGFYVDGASWRELWAEGRHLLRVISHARSSPGESPVSMQMSAGVLWDLPLYRVSDRVVHTLIRGARHTRTVAGITRHDVEVADNDIVERHGLRCTSLTRTVFDMVRTMPPEAAISAADAALRMMAVSGRRQDAAAAEQWREELLRLAAPGFRGVRKVRWAVGFADGRAQLPGESVSRLQLSRLGFHDIHLQVPVVGSEGDRYFMDFGFPRSRMFGEFDGEGKYLEPELRETPTPVDAVLAEKRREDDVRGVTGWGVRRWGSVHIKSVDALGARLTAFGIHPPG
ncbi:type IV toxin-antitoxin system AbiEi family antitoxin domain-containing protein [Microbacterium murale]|uniref:AbiEi antitoxin N-terminal domain-containing protein n=1 Tax=Microbacterium murale TaxID=1081040 RepID=A0ABQ1RS42_9MICO|nr:type IV toxin-antitoxin system AbiEi family antitoxin domain-containing protein [Microbacterium murale]GGD79817.1 hypothetical protein GCM10007269_23410 [Microbacterium murale]